MGIEQCPSPSDPDAYLNRIYPYCPSFGAAILFTILFAGVFLAHLTQAIIHRKTYCWVICMAAAWEGIGWGFRAASTLHDDRRIAQDTNLSIISTLFILVAPIWLNAFIYMTFGRMVHFFLPEQKVWRISARWLTLIFVLLDIVSFIVQVIGALMLAGSGDKVTQSTIQNGLNTYMTGVGIQELFIFCFFGLSLAFRKRAQEWRSYRQQTSDRLLYVLWAVLVLISVRIIYRIAEFSAGTDSYATTHEWLIYVWDATPMWLAMLLLNVFHPAKALVGPESEFPKLTKQQKREEKAAKKQQKIDRSEAKKGNVRMTDMDFSSEGMMV